MSQLLSPGNAKAIFPEPDVRELNLDEAKTLHQQKLDPNDYVTLEFVAQEVSIQLDALGNMALITKTGVRPGALKLQETSGLIMVSAPNAVAQRFVEALGMGTVKLHMSFRRSEVHPTLLEEPDEDISMGNESPEA